MSAKLSTNWQCLERHPKSAYKQLFVKGTRIRARILYGSYMSEEEPRTIEQIAADYNLPVEAVREAIAYCDTDPIEIREDFAREEAIMEATGQNDPNYKYNPSPKLLSPQEVSRIYREVEARFAQEADASDAGSCTSTTTPFTRSSSGYFSKPATPIFYQSESGSPVRQP